MLDDIMPQPLPPTKIPQFANDGEAVAWLGADAAKWTALFLHTTDLANAGPDFQHTVFGWFANSIEVGRSAGYAQAKKEHNPNWPLPKEG